MMSVLFKAIKFPKLLNLRLSFSCVKSNYNVIRFIRPHRHVFNRKTYATVAYEQIANEERFVLKGKGISDTTNLNDIDRGLAKIDQIVKRNGRILMKDVVDVFNMIDKEVATSTHGLFLIRCCKYICFEPPSRRIEFVHQIWNRFQELGIKFDIKHYNALLLVQISNGHSFDPAKFLNDMEEQQIGINQETCMLLMKKYCKDGNIGGACEILGYIKKKELPASEQVFNYLIEGHLRNDDFSGAKDILESMKSSNLQPTEDTYSIFASSYAAKGDIAGMMSYMHASGIHMSNKNYLEVIEALATSGCQIDDMLSLMKNIDEYQQEIINLAVELIHKGFVDAAYKLVTASADAQNRYGTDIFIKQLIKTDKPISQVVFFTNDIFKKGLNDFIYDNAAKAAVELGNFDCATLFFKEKLSQGYSLRNSNFWPIFSYLKETKNIGNISVLLKVMYDLGISAEFTTYVDYVFPIFGIPLPKDVIHCIEESGQSLQTAIDALFVYYCDLGEVDHAFLLTQIVPVSVNYKFDFKNFLNRLESYPRNVPDNCLEVLKFILERVESDGVLQGKHLVELISNKPHIFEALVQKFRNVYFAINKQALNICLKQLNLNPSSMALLKKLKIKHFEDKRDMSVQEENLQLDYFQARNLPFKPFLTERIFSHIRSKNTERVSELLSIYEKNGFTYLPLMLSQLISLYSTSPADLTKTKEFVAQLKNFPTFKLGVDKVLDFAALLIHHTEFDEALAVLKDYLTEPYQYSNKEYVLRSSRRIIALVCETGNVEFVKNIQNLLMPLSKEFGSKKLYLEPLINVHLHRNDIKSAFEEYRSCIMSHHIPACLNILLKKCIATYDKSLLQKTIDISIDYVGKNLTLLELAVAFIEAGYVSKAVTVFQNLGEEVNESMLEQVCIRMRDQNKLAHLEKFIYATKSLDHIDRGKLYYHFLQVCANRNDYNKAVNTFNTLNEEGIKPDYDMNNLLMGLLRQNTHDPTSNSILSKLSEYTFESTIKPTKDFRKYLEEGDAIKALNELHGLKKGFIRSLSYSNFTDLIDLCLQKNCLKDLSSNEHAMSYIIDNSKEVLKPVLEKYSSAGDFQKLISIANSIPDFTLKSMGFNSYFCNSFISCGKHDHLLSQLELCCESDRKNKMFSVVAFEELLNFPEFEERVKNLAVRYLDFKLDIPIAALWAHYFTEENYDKADEMYALHKKQMTNSFPVDKIDQKILRSIRQHQNISLGEKYISFISQINVRPRVKERAYAALLDVLVSKQMHDEAVVLVIEAEKLQLQLHKYYRNTLLTLKGALERENKPVPFIITQEN